MRDKSQGLSPERCRRSATRRDAQGLLSRRRRPNGRALPTALGAIVRPGRGTPLNMMTFIGARSAGRKRCKALYIPGYRRVLLHWTRRRRKGRLPADKDLDPYPPSTPPEFKLNDKHCPDPPLTTELPRIVDISPVWRFGFLARAVRRIAAVHPAPTGTRTAPRRQSRRI